MVQKAIGDRLYCLFIDHGLLRAGETREIEETFNQEFDTQLKVVDARDRFFKQA